MARTPKISEDRRELILDAALRVFASKGFDRASNKDIAREAGITTGLIYHYFESKAALLRALLDERMPIPQMLKVYTEMENQPPEVMLRGLANAILEITEDTRRQKIFRLFLPELLYNQTIAGLGLGGLQEGTRFLAAYLQKQMEAGVLRPGDALLAAQIFIGGLMGFILRRELLHDPLALRYSRAEIVDTLVETTLRGLAC